MYKATLRVRVGFPDFYSAQSRSANSEIVRSGRHIVRRASGSKRETRSTGSAASFVSANRRNVQLDQFSNISGTGQCPGRASRCGAGTEGRPSNEIYLLIQMSRNEKDLSRTYRAATFPFLFFPLSFSPFIPTGVVPPSPRDTHAEDFLPFVRIKTTQLPTSRHADGKVTTGSATDVH